jgi:formylglycine-generating enzyme required for sulfatase activity
MIYHLFSAALIITLLSSPSFATLTGRVIDRSSAPVAGARVALLKANATATTQEDGTFSIITAAVVHRKTAVPPVGLAAVTKGSTVFVSVSRTSGPVRVAVYSIKGELIAASVCRAGTPGIKFREMRGSSVLRIENSGMVSTIRLPPFSSAIIRSQAPVIAPVVKTGAHFAAVDTLRITKSGFVGKIISLQSTDAQLGDITVSAVDSGMVLIPAKDSSFQMGSETGPTNEQPVHAVGFTGDFYMDTVEVTQKSYKALLDKSPWVVSVGTSAYTELNASTGETKAAVYMTWFDAVIYCNARSKRDGLDTVYTYLSKSDSAPGQHCRLTGLTSDFSIRGYRLATEAEWEYACRAGTTTAYFWGNDTTGLESHAVCRYNSYDLGSGSPQYGVNAVGTKSPNAFGLYDMAGNVYEMCNDFWSTTYYNTSPAKDPIGPETGTRRIYRGGSWKINEAKLTSSSRNAIDVDMNTYATEIGFRCVITAD